MGHPLLEQLGHAPPTRVDLPALDPDDQAGRRTLSGPLVALNHAQHVPVPTGNRVPPGAHPDLPSRRSSLVDAASHDDQHNAAVLIMD